MATRILHPEYRDELYGSRYPFADYSTLTNSEGLFIAPEIFADAVIYPIGGAERMYISNVNLASSGCTITIGDANTADLCEGAFNPFSPPESVRLLDGYGRPAGMLVAYPNALATFQAWTIGDHRFTVEQTEFAAVCCVPSPGVGLQGFILDDGTVMSGDVWFVGGDGVVLSYETLPATDENGQVVEEHTIRVDIVGDPLFKRRTCAAPILFQAPRPIRTITFQRGCDKFVCEPDDYGNIQIDIGHNNAADTVLRLRRTSTGLQFEAAGERTL